VKYFSEKCHIQLKNEKRPANGCRREIEKQKRDLKNKEKKL
jgi:hypothetical protein